MSLTNPNNRRRKLSTVRHFGIMADGRLVATRERGPGDAEFLVSQAGTFHPNEVTRRCNKIIGTPFLEVQGSNRYKAAFVGETKVTLDDIECVYNDWMLTNSVLGSGAYESVANDHELAVLVIAKQRFNAEVCQ